MRQTPIIHHCIFARRVFAAGGSPPWSLLQKHSLDKHFFPSKYFQSKKRQNHEDETKCAGDDPLVAAELTTNSAATNQTFTIFYNYR